MEFYILFVAAAISVDIVVWAACRYGSIEPYCGHIGHSIGHIGLLSTERYEPYIH